MTEPKDPTLFNEPDSGIFQPEDIDSVAQAILTLAHELWIVKDRMIVLEEILKDHGIDAFAEIEKYAPRGRIRERIDEAGQKLMTNVISSLSGQ